MSDLCSRGIVLCMLLKIKALISCLVTAQLICAFDFAYAKHRVFHDAVHMELEDVSSMRYHFFIFFKQIIVFKYISCIHQLWPLKDAFNYFPSIANQWFTLNESIDCWNPELKMRKCHEKCYENKLMRLSFTLR